MPFLESLGESLSTEPKSQQNMMGHDRRSETWHEAAPPVRLAGLRRQRRDACRCLVSMAQMGENEAIHHVVVMPVAVSNADSTQLSHRGTVVELTFLEDGIERPPQAPLEAVPDSDRLLPTHPALPWRIGILGEALSLRLKLSIKRDAAITCHQLVGDVNHFPLADRRAFLNAHFAMSGHNSCYRRKSHLIQDAGPHIVLPTLDGVVEQGPGADEPMRQWQIPRPIA